MTFSSLNFWGKSPWKQINGLQKVGWKILTAGYSGASTVCIIGPSLDERNFKQNIVFNNFE